MSTKSQIAVAFVNYGPYHIARAAALAAWNPGARFIELAATEELYPWKASKDILEGRLVTLETRPYERCNIRALSAKLIKCLEHISPDTVVIAGYSEAPMRAAARWARRRAAGVVMMSETTARDEPRRRWREFVKSGWIARYVDAALVGGRPHREYLRNLGLPDTRIWEHYDVVDNAYFIRRTDAARADGYLRSRLGLTQKYFLYVGRFAPEKNLEFLLRAFRLYRDCDPEGWDLVMVGDGPQRCRLEALAQDLRLPVRWPGFTQIDALPPYYAFAGCFILPSVREPWGLVVNEAMASGLPVAVSTRCGCAADLVQAGRNGFHFRCDDPSDLAEVMNRISSMSAEQLSQMGAESRRIIADWTPEVWAEGLSQAVEAARNSKTKASAAAEFRIASLYP